MKIDQQKVKDYNVRDVLKKEQVVESREEISLNWYARRISRKQSTCSCCIGVSRKIFVEMFIENSSPVPLLQY